MITSSEKTAMFSVADGTELFYRYYSAEDERARLIVSHGLGEHSGRYENIVSPLLTAGISVWAPDHRGHGRSAGKRGHVTRFNQYIDDLKVLVALVRKDLPAGRKCCLLGHSMGGLIATRYTQQHANSIDALILSSPALGMVVAVPAVKQWLARVTSAILPGLSMGNELDATKISHDSEVVQSYQNDPLVHDRVSARWFTEFLAAMQYANDNAGTIQVPVLMQVAGDDHLVSASSSKRFFDRLTTSDKTFHRYEGLYHEIYNAPTDQRQCIVKDLVSWIGERMRP